MHVPEWLDDLVPLIDPTAVPRVVSLAEAARCGFTEAAVRWRLGRGTWVRLAPGIYCTAPPVGRADHLWAAARHGGAGAVVSGQAALYEYGLDVPAPASELLLVPLTCGARSYGRIVVRRTPTVPGAAERPGAPLAPAERAVCDFARTLRRAGDVRAVVAEAVRRHLCTAADLRRELDRSARHGRALLRRAVLEIADGARSAPEARAATLLRRHRLGPFAQNALIAVRGRVFYADFLWRHRSAILEIDSVEHHFSREDWRYTLDRHLVLESAGYSVVHVPPSALEDEYTFVGNIRTWLESRPVGAIV